MTKIQSTSPPPMLNLPRDIKWMIFDLFLKSFTFRPPVLDSYALPHQWPEHPDLSDFLGLSSTCQELRTETLSYLEQRCMPEMLFYFDNMPALHDFYHGVLLAKPEYLPKVRFSLRSRCHLLCPDPDCSGNQAIIDFMIDSLGVIVWKTLMESALHEKPGEQGWYDWAGTSGARLHVQHQGTAIIDTLHIPCPNHTTLVGRGIRGLGDSEYWEMRSTLGALDRSGYDAEVVGDSYLEALCKGAENLKSSQGRDYGDGMKMIVKALCEIEA